MLELYCCNLYMMLHASAACSMLGIEKVQMADWDWCVIPHWSSSDCDLTRGPGDEACFLVFCWFVSQAFLLIFEEVT